MLTAACLSLPRELSSSILLAPRRRQPPYSPCIKHQPASPPRAAADLSKDEPCERERKRGGKNSQVTITAGQYFMKMKCSGTVYTAARETQQACKALISWSFSCAVRVKKGVGGRWQLPGASWPVIDQYGAFPREKSTVFFPNNKTYGPFACCFPSSVP